MEDTKTGRIMLVAAHRTLRQALRQSLERHGVHVVADAPMGREAVAVAVVHRPHVVLVDLASDAEAGLGTCREFREAGIHTHLVALAPRLGPAGHQARAEAVVGLVDAEVSIEDLVGFLATAGQRHASRTRRRHAPRAAHATLLTDREIEVLALAATGLSDGQISHALYISYKTVRNHLHHVYAKLGARSRTEAVTVGLRHGLISL